MNMNNEIIKKQYELAKEQYAAIGVDTEKALEGMKNVVISMHCWQTDDVGGFETPEASLSGGGIQATGNYPGKATTIEQMRADLEKVMQLLPGKQRLSLHASYLEENLLTAMLSDPNILRAGSTGPGRRELASILTEHSSLIPKLPADLPFHPRMRASASSGWNI